MQPRQTTSQNQLASNLRKQALIPDEWKNEIDEHLINDLLNANRYFAKTNPHLSVLTKDASHLTPESFLRELKDRWSWHHEFYEDLLEQALPLLIETSSIHLSPHQVQKLIKCYQTASQVDNATLVMTAAIKQHLEYWTKPDKSLISLEEERLRLITIPTEVFWARYLLDHIEFELARRSKNSDADIMQENLASNYHIGDSLIMEGRIKALSHWLSKTTEELILLKQQLTISRDYKIQYNYLTIERPRLKAIRDILEYDNIEEYKILTSLKGISGYILRKKILEYIYETKLLSNTEKGIYAFDDLTVIKALEKLNQYRSEMMNKEVRIYNQSKNDSCSAACLSMILAHFGMAKDNIQTEMAIYEASKASTTPGSHFSGIALEAAKTGLEVILIHSEPGMFRNDGIFDKDTFNQLLHEYCKLLNEAESIGSTTLNGQPVNSQTIRKYLAHGYLVIAAGHIGGGILHARTICGYNQQGLVICDPTRRKREVLRDSIMDRFLITPIGSWMMAIRQDQSSLLKLDVSIPKFQKQALFHLQLSTEHLDT